MEPKRIFLGSSETITTAISNDANVSTKPQNPWEKKITTHGDCNPFIAPEHTEQQEYYQIPKNRIKILR